MTGGPRASSHCRGQAWLPPPSARHLSPSATHFRQRTAQLGLVLKASVAASCLCRWPRPPGSQEGREERIVTLTPVSRRLPATGSLNPTRLRMRRGCHPVANERDRVPWVLLWPTCWNPSPNVPDWTPSRLHGPRTVKGNPHFPWQPLAPSPGRLTGHQPPCHAGLESPALCASCRTAPDVSGAARAGTPRSSRPFHLTLVSGGSCLLRTPPTHSGSDQRCEPEVPHCLLPWRFSLISFVR